MELEKEVKKEKETKVVTLEELQDYLDFLADPRTLVTLWVIVFVIGAVVTGIVSGVAALLS